MSLLRIAAAAAVALSITFGLFFLMQYLISIGQDEIGKAGDASTIEFVRLKRESELQTRKRQLPKKEKPPEPPPPPDIAMNNDAPEGDTLDIAAPNVDINPEMAGGLALGTTSDSESVPIVRVNPQYPMRATERGIEGWVVVEFTITAAGTVKDVVVVDAKPQRIFDRSAIRAVKKWKYRPRIVDGVAVERRERTKLDFELDSAES